MLLDLQPQDCEFKPNTDRKLSCLSTSSSHTSPPRSDGDLEFFGVQIHWPWLVNKLRIQVGLWVPISISCESWSVLLGAPSPAPGVCLHWLKVPAQCTGTLTMSGAHDHVTAAREFAFVCVGVHKYCMCMCVVDRRFYQLGDQC